MSQEANIQFAVELIEKHVEDMYRLAFAGTPKPPPIDMFKASAMAEIARRIRNKAVKIEEDYLHFTRE